MSELDPDSGTSRDDLVKRIELMEAMIAEGRRYTGRNSWIFVVWGIVDLVAWNWQHYSRHFGGRWAWPICLSAGVLLTLAGKAMQRTDQGYSSGDLCGKVMSVWGMMGLTMGIYIASAMLTHFDWQFSYVAGLLMLLGMAHAISATILQWKVQGIVAALYWAGGVAIFVLNSWKATSTIMLLEMGVLMILFGLYATRVEPKNDGRKGARA
jgi:hypothetical protein